MNFRWSEDKISFKNKVLAFANAELRDDLIDRDTNGAFSFDFWQRCADFGVQGLATKRAYGGANTDVDIMAAILAMEAMGMGCRDNGLSFALSAQMWTVQLPIGHFGSEAQKQKYLPPLCSGRLIGAHALTEAEAGSDVFSMKTQAEKVEGGYMLNGSKRLITLAPVADVFLIFAVVNPSLGKWGIAAFLVEKNTPGFVIKPEQSKMGLRTVPIGELELKDCFISEDQLLGSEGSGFSILNTSLGYDRGCILASQVGAMQRQLDRTVKFAQDRNQYDRSIAKFQSVSNRIVEMRVRLETSRLLLYKVAWLLQEGESATLEATMLKLHLSENFVNSSMDAIRTHGGRGYLTECEVERDLRDAIGGVLYAGTSDIQKNIIAGLMGL